MYTYRQITNGLLDSLVNDIENTCEEMIFDIGEHTESNDAFYKEVREARNEILLALVHKINLKYLNQYTQD